jgi:hypothetical protein
MKYKDKNRFIIPIGNIVIKFPKPFHYFGGCLNNALEHIRWNKTKDSRLARIYFKTPLSFIVVGKRYRLLNDVGDLHPDHFNTVNFEIKYGNIGVDESGVLKILNYGDYDFILLKNKKNGV